MFKSRFPWSRRFVRTDKTPISPLQEHKHKTFLQLKTIVISLVGREGKVLG